MEFKHNFKLVNKLILVKELIEIEYLNFRANKKERNDEWLNDCEKAYITVSGYIHDIITKDDVTKLFPAALTALKKVPVWSNTGTPLSLLEKKKSYHISKTGGYPVSLYDYLYTDVTVSVDSQVKHKAEKPINPFKYTNGYEVLLVMIEEKIRELTRIRKPLLSDGASGELDGFNELYSIIANVEKRSNEMNIQQAIENILKRTYVRSDNGVKLNNKELDFFKNSIAKKEFKFGTIYPVTQYSYLYENPTRYWEC